MDLVYIAAAVLSVFGILLMNLGAAINRQHPPYANGNLVIVIGIALLATGVATAAAGYAYQQYHI